MSANADGLAARLIDQYRDYAAFYLTEDEAAEIAETLHLAPHAALGITPGQIVNLADVKIHILPPLEIRHPRNSL